MLNIVVPMAGHGSRFIRAGYKIPKPLIPVHGKPMIRIVVENLTPSTPHRFIFVCQQEHLDGYELGHLLRGVAPGCEIIPVSQVTEGAACTVLLAKHLIDNDTPLMIANCDQYVDIRIDDYLTELDGQKLDGLIMTMTANDPKWSYVLLDDENNIQGVVEKAVVSNEATVGLYNYRQGRMFVAAAQEMMRHNLRVNNEFYVAPAYNQMIAAGRRIGFFNIGGDRDGMYGLGTPEDLDFFLSTPISKNASNMKRGARNRE
jgi:dTDP-glucose pyrophosphorylase